MVVGKNKIVRYLFCFGCISCNRCCSRLCRFCKSDPTPNYQRRNGLRRTLGGRCVGRSTGHILQRDAVHKALGHLVLQFQYDALGQLGPHAVGRLKGLVVPGRNSQRHPLRLHDAQDGQPHLGAHAGHGSEHLKAGLLLLGGKAIQAHVVFGHTHHGVEGGFLAHAGQGPRHTGRALGIVAHAAAAEHHRTHAFFYDFSSQTVDHGSHLRSARPHGG